MSPLPSIYYKWASTQSYCSFAHASRFIFLAGKGNTAYACAEFNFGCDPEAAQLVLHGLHAPITIFPWEINLSELAGQPWVSYYMFAYHAFQLFSLPF